eukprot:gene22789-biopygen31438
MSSMLVSLDIQLLQSSRAGDVYEVVSLIERGADVNCKDIGSTQCTGGRTPLHNAAREGHVECIKALLDRGAEVETQDNYGRTPLQDAAWKGNVECIKALLDRGAEVNTQDSVGSTPLHKAACNGHVECIKALLDSGAVVDTQNNDGSTPLHGAACNGHVGCVKALLDRGAEVTIKNILGNTALDTALGYGRQAVAAAIRNGMSRRADANRGDDQPPTQTSGRPLQTNKRQLSTQPVAARSRIEECEEHLAMARSRNHEYEVQLATARAKNDEYEVYRACMTGQGDIIASQDVETLERLLSKVDIEYLRKAIFDKCVQREINKARDAATECGICLSAPKDTCLHPCGHMVCRSCSDLIQLCPICRQTIAERRRVFL